MDSNIHDLLSLAKYFGLHCCPAGSPQRVQEGIAKALYKTTACGAKVTFFTDGIQLFASDELNYLTVSSPKLAFPFDSEELDAAIYEIEHAAEQLEFSKSTPEQLSSSQ